ncbi:MAG: type II toxin-antitoxin system VapC family toxin [Cyclobacteriaceae bacterium]
MRILLDTHLLLWLLIDHPRLRSDTRTLLKESDLLISSLSCYEIQHKRAIGKLHGNVEISELFVDGMFTELPFTYQHAEYTLQLPMIHRDPFDRMMIAQSIVEGIPLVTADKTIHQYDFEFIAV